MAAVALPISNPPSPWSSTEVEWDIEPPPAPLEIFYEDAKSMLSKNTSPDLGFSYSVNPYRGCYHGCAYCYARRSHQYWGFGAGTDFDRKLIVKRNAAEVLNRELSKKSWKKDVIVFSGNTDCYQPIEAHYRLTRQCLEVARQHRTPVAIITKSSVILRDAQFLADMSNDVKVSVVLSMAFDNDDDRKKIEPFASPIEKRLKAMTVLSDLGIRVGVSLAPIIPGLNDHAAPRILEMAKAHGASYAFATPVRLPGEVLPVFQERIEAAIPLRSKKIMNAIFAMRGNGRFNNADFGERMNGTGERWDASFRLFVQAAKRLGMWTEPESPAYWQGESEALESQFGESRVHDSEPVDAEAPHQRNQAKASQLGFDF